MRVKSFLTVATAAGGISVAAMPANAAPIAYEAAVQANSPYVYYRLNDASGSTTADDTSANNRDGTYVNSPTLGVAGFGAGSDTAASFSPTSAHLLAPISTFGASVPNSTYEFILKADTPAFTQVSSIFGVINADPDGAGVGRTGNQAVGIEANAAGVNATNTPGTSRIWLRDEDGSQLWANFEHGSLLDGNYHHFAIGVDMSAATAIEKVRAYLDGVPLTVSAAAESAALADNWQDFTVNAALAARNVRDTSVDRFSPITVDEMALFSTTLTPEQIAVHATATGIPEPGALALTGVAALGLLRRRRVVG